MGPSAWWHLNEILLMGPYWPKNFCWLGILTLLVFIIIILENIQKQRSDTVIFLHLHAINCFNTLEVRVSSNVIVWEKEIPSEDLNNTSETRLCQVWDGIIWVWVWNYIRLYTYIWYIFRTVCFLAIWYRKPDQQTEVFWFHITIHKTKLTSVTCFCGNVT